MFTSLNAVEIPRHPDTFSARQAIFQELNRQNSESRQQLLNWLETERQILQQVALHNIEVASQALMLINQANGILMSYPNRPELRDQVTHLLRQVSTIQNIQQIHANAPHDVTPLRDTP